ncbi:type IV toxin-antitoxin system AbiEi family antitoxin [Prosthecobacter sp.]
MNTVISMNTPHSSRALERSLEGKLRELLGSVDWLPEVSVSAASQDAGFDLQAMLPLPTGGRAALCVECKQEMRPSTFPMLVQRDFKPAGRPKIIVRVLALPWVSPRVADLCAEHGWSWYDLAGNCRLDVPGVLRIERSGNAPVHAVPRPVANLGTKEAGRVVRALLFDPEQIGQPWTQRALSEARFPFEKSDESVASLGLVNKMVRHLMDEGFIEPLPKSGFMVTEPLKLLFAWRDAYRFEQHERHEYFSLLQGRQLSESIIKLYTFHTEAEYAAFSAADFQAPHVRQPKTWLYVASKALVRFAQVAQAKPVDSGGNLVVLVPSDDGVFYRKEYLGDNEHRSACSNALQTYVDLWHCGGRGQEAAEALLEQKIKPEWRAAGLKA